MNRQEISEEHTNALLDIMKDEGDDRITFDDYESPSGLTANREVVCPNGYVFHAFIIIPDGEQICYEQAERALDRHTLKSFRYLLERGKAGLVELL